MTTIKASCPICGDVDLAPVDMTVTHAPAAGWAFYAFRCPLCGEAVSGRADPDTVDLLLGAGVPEQRVDVPAEALEVHIGSPISADDVLDAVLWLRSSTDGAIVSAAQVVT